MILLLNISTYCNQKAIIYSYTCNNFFQQPFLLGMQNKFSPPNQPSMYFIWMVLFFTMLISACNTPENAAKIIQKKVQQRTSRLCISTSIRVSQKLNKLECFMGSPSISESIYEKTELISSW